VRPIKHASGWRVSTLGRVTPSKEMEDLFWYLFALHDHAGMNIDEDSESNLDLERHCATVRSNNTNNNIENGGSEKENKISQLKNLLDPEYTYIFEMCGKHNKVVTMCV
jgi:hypothetical protein